jgi:hypothetical protein
MPSLTDAAQGHDRSARLLVWWPEAGLPVNNPHPNTGSAGGAGLRQEIRDEADVDGGTPGAGSPGRALPPDEAVTEFRGDLQAISRARTVIHAFPVSNLVT